MTMLHAVQTDETTDAGDAWWSEVAHLTVNAATLEWLLRQLIRGEAAVNARLAAALLPRQFAQAVDVAENLADYSIPLSARSLVIAWLEQVRDAISRRDALMTGFAADSLSWTVTAEGHPAVATIRRAAPPWPLQQLADVNASLQAAIATGRALLVDLGDTESRFADLIADPA